MSDADGANSEIETGLIVPVPALEEFVTKHRSTNAAVPPAGVPAHVTLLYPFLSPNGCDVSKADIAEFFAEVEPFEFELTEVGWFDERVVYLAPADPAPFVDLTERLIGRWTECIPYGGRHGGKHVPHLTLGIEGTPEEMASLAEAAEALLPIRCRAEEAWLMVGTPHPAAWEPKKAFAFGGARPGQDGPDQDGTAEP